ncbi:hypothetical protein D3C72_1112910 [compost metagenome]
MRPGKFKYAVGDRVIAIFFQQRQAELAVFAHAIQDIDGDREAGLQGDGLADRQHRVQHGAGAVTERPALPGCLCIRWRPATSEELRPVSFKRDAALTAAMHHHHVE